jgi:hypothetical protein
MTFPIIPSERASGDWINYSGAMVLVPVREFVLEVMGGDQRALTAELW